MRHFLLISGAALTMLFCTVAESQAGFGVSINIGGGRYYGGSYYNNYPVRYYSAPYYNAYPTYNSYYYGSVYRQPRYDYYGPSLRPHYNHYHYVPGYYGGHHYHHHYFDDDDDYDDIYDD